MKTTIFSRPLPTGLTASLEGLSLGWKGALGLLSLAAAAVCFYHTLRYESAGAWMYHFWTFALLTLLLFILIVIQASRTRRSYFDVYRFAVQPGTTYTLSAEPLFPLYAQLLVYPPGDAPTPPDSESAFSPTQSGDAWVSLYGVSNTGGDEGTGLYRVSLECAKTP